MPHLLCFGLGYTATALAARLAREGWTISATSTTPEGTARIAVLGYDAHLFDGAGYAPAPALAAAIHAATHAVTSAPPIDAGDPVLIRCAAEIAASPNLRWFAYLSTIGVYGDHGGAWIDETAPATPRSVRSQRRANAEATWLGLGRATRKTALVFRIAGIYGPGRSAIDTVLNGTARRLIKPGQVFNRIHRDDIASMLAAAISSQPSHAIFNVCDDEPAPPQDVIAFAATVLGRPVPPDVPYDPANLTPMAASFYSENKRCSNARAKSDLVWQPAFPTYREGLSAIAATRQRDGRTTEFRDETR